MRKIQSASRRNSFQSSELCSHWTQCCCCEDFLEDDRRIICECIQTRLSFRCAAVNTILHDRLGCQQFCSMGLSTPVRWEKGVSSWSESSTMGVQEACNCFHQWWKMDLPARCWNTFSESQRWQDRTRASHFRHPFKSVARFLQNMVLQDAPPYRDWWSLLWKY